MWKYILQRSQPFTTIPTKLKPLSNYKEEAIKLIAIPINSNQTYIHFKHVDKLTNNRSKLISWERRFVNKCSQYWDKINKSPKPVNKRISSIINRYLNQIPWQETSFLSIPGEHYIMKRIYSHDMKDKLDQGESSVKIITAKEYKRIYPQPKLVPISLYFPKKLITNDILKGQLDQMVERGLKFHKWETWKCLILLPLTLPIIMVPIIPNVPGFYLSYRVYCNLKAYLGAKHLGKILHNGSLEFKDLGDCNHVFDDGGNLTPHKIDQITSQLDIPEIKSALKKAVFQESNPTKDNPN